MNCRVKQNTLYFKRMILDLARFLDVEPTIDSVIAARNKAVAAGYGQYVSRLYGDAGLETLIFDFGVPLPMLDVDQVQGELPVEVVPVFRIEPLIADLLKTDIGWSEFKRRFDDAIVDALTNKGYSGVKSIIAYRTGLDVSPLTRTPDQGLQALDAIRRGLGGGSMKKLRDHLLCRSLELCMEHDVPMQIHTGMGDFEVNLVLCRPAYLMDLLRFPAYRSCRVLLVHSGFPYHREAAYMANVLPRVYVDVSEGIPFAAHAAGHLPRRARDGSVEQGLLRLRRLRGAGDQLHQRQARQAGLAAASTIWSPKACSPSVTQSRQPASSSRTTPGNSIS